MSFRWKKLGLVFSPNGQFEWMQTHATLTTAISLGNDIYRVYFSSRDHRNRNHVSFIEFNIHEPTKTLRLAGYPVLAPGPLGYFDDSGVYAGSFVQYDGLTYMFYAGWNPGLHQPMFYSSIGIAVSEDGGNTFTKRYKAPIMQRDEVDPWMVAAPFVLLDGGIWRMWYISGLGWADDGQRSFYHIKYAESRDGVHWQRDGKVALELKAGESNIARLCVVKTPSGYEGWYSFVADHGYRIGYATSSDGYEWVRKDEEAAIGVSESGWDSEAVAYPYVFFHKGKRYMLYNGNRFGKDGFGLAAEEI